MGMGFARQVVGYVVLTALMVAAHASARNKPVGAIGPIGVAANILCGGWDLVWRLGSQRLRLQPGPRRVLGPCSKRRSRRRVRWTCWSECGWTRCSRNEDSVRLV